MLTRPKGRAKLVEIRSSPDRERPAAAAAAFQKFPCFLQNPLLHHGSSCPPSLAHHDRVGRALRLERAILQALLVCHYAIMQTQVDADHASSRNANGRTRGGSERKETSVRPSILLATHHPHRSRPKDPRSAHKP